MDSYAARIVLNADRHHVLQASRTLAPIGGMDRPVLIRTSARVTRPRLDPAAFSDAERATHRRRADGGADKGRLLYVLAGRSVIAFLGIHVPPKGPIICEAFGADHRLTDQQQALLLEHLVACATELSAKLGRTSGCIAWATNSRSAEKLLTAFGFEPSTKPAGSDCDRRYYYERSVEQ